MALPSLSPGSLGRRSLSMRWLDPSTLASAEARETWAELLRKGILFDWGSAEHLSKLRKEVARIAGQMREDGGRPPMYWTGIPYPERRSLSEGDWCLSISVGGTNTVFLLLRLDEGRVIGLDPEGVEVDGEDLSDLAAACRLETPAAGTVADGFDMVRRICGEIGRRLRPQRALLDKCQQVLLSWGYPGRSIRTGSSVLGGLTAVTSKMTKGQSAFTEDLAGRDIGELFREQLEESLDWSCPVTVANDTVMALHWFLRPEIRERHAQIGLFINGTGANFAIAEPYAVRPEGIVSDRAESYTPRRLERGQLPAAGERLIRYFVNYEIGSLALEATRTEFDGEPVEYSYENDAMAGGTAFRQMFQRIVQGLLGADFHESLLQAFRSRGSGEYFDAPGGPEVAQLATGGQGAFEQLFPGSNADLARREQVILISAAICARSALHVALVLAATTERTCFGLGQVGDDGVPRPDLLAMEGSVWKTAGYPELVEEFWGRLVSPDRLQVCRRAEEHFNASLRGPVFLDRLHRPD